MLSIDDNDSKMVVDVACALIRDATGRFLVCRRASHVRDAGVWEFPGGKVERGETPGDCVRRELKEELGVDAVADPPIASAAATVSGRQLRLHACHTTIASHPRESTDHDRIVYVSLDELLLLPVTAAETALLEILKDIP